MEYRKLGRSGVKVSPLCLGTMMFGGPTDERDSARIIARAREVGINFIDTADAYNEGGSEEIVGRAIGANRNDWVLTTKMCNAMGPGPNQRGLSRRWMFQACDASLARLGTHWVDIMYLHREDYDTPLEETVIAMAQARIESLEPEARHVLRAASVFGQVFWRSGVAALVGDTATQVHDWLDELVRLYKLAAPNHIKLDVDGAELEVLSGASHTLSHPELQTLMVEIKSDHESAVVDLLGAAGFGVEARYQRRPTAPFYTLFRRR